MFKESYKKAYDAIKPDVYLTEKILMRAEEKKNGRRFLKPLITVAATSFAVVLIMSFTIMPVLAANVPKIYVLLDSISPMLADFFVPVKESCTSQGIIMQVEAVYVNGREAEIYLSFRDAEESGTDRINGAVDLFNSYGLRSGKGRSAYAGSSFVKYEEETGKAYFKVSVGAEEAFDNDCLTFYVNELLCDIGQKKKDISLAGMVYETEFKNVTLSGAGGSQDVRELLDDLRAPQNADDPRPAWKVLEGKTPDACSREGITVTGIAYLDGILHLQICRGGYDKGDSYLQPFLVYGNGEEKHQDYSVMWKEDVDGQRYVFEEFYFTVGKEELADCSMYGIFHTHAGYVKGDWEVTFRIRE